MRKLSESLSVALCYCWHVVPPWHFCYFWGFIIVPLIKSVYKIQGHVEVTLPRKEIVCYSKTWSLSDSKYNIFAKSRNMCASKSQNKIVMKMSCTKVPEFLLFVLIFLNLEAPLGFKYQQLPLIAYQTEKEFVGCRAKDLYEKWSGYIEETG